MAQPQWVTPAGDLGTIAEGLFFSVPLSATDSDGGTVKYLLIAGSLPEGIQVTVNGTVEGVPLPYARVKGVPTEVAEDVTSNFVIRAYVVENGTTRINDRTFSLTVTGQDLPTFTTAAGSLGNFYDGDVVDINIEFSDSDPGETFTVSIEGGALPPGLTIDNTGKISGYILPVAPLPDTAIAGFDRDGTEFEEFPFDFTTRSISLTYEFTVAISDGKETNLRTFSMFVNSRDSLTADTLDYTSDDNDITADVLPQRTPFVTNYPTSGNIGTYRHDNFFAYQIIGLDLDGDPFEFEIVAGDSADLPPGITFDRSNGWLTGYFPDAGATETTYDFAITIYKKNNPLIVSNAYDYSITVIGDIETAVTWLTGTQIGTTSVYDLGTIDNGDTSLLKVEASTADNRVLSYRLKSGAANKLPQGTSLLPSGLISGRVSFNGFALDSGTTTFDELRSTRLEVDPTTFDSSFTFTVNAYTIDGEISVFRTFKITVNRKYNTPYENLYIQATPDSAGRSLIQDLVYNRDIFEPSRIYRYEDPFFGIAQDVTYTHAFGLTASTLSTWFDSVDTNHFRKKLLLGEIKTAQALDANDNVLYEVIYSEIVDTGVNQQGLSPPQSINWPVTITIPGEDYPDRLSNTSTGTKVALSSMTSTYLEPARNANMLANICSQMARDWADSGSPGDPAGTNPSATFNWSFRNTCETYEAEPLRYAAFSSQLSALASSGNIIYSEYYQGKTADGEAQRHVEPFAFLVEEGDYAYLVIRGTLNEANGKLDIDAAYKVDNPMGEGKIGRGWLKAFQGLGVDDFAKESSFTRSGGLPGITLKAALTGTSKTKLRIASHSLGSAMATLAAAYAQKLNIFDDIEGYPSASPRVGGTSFKNWFNNLSDINGNSFGTTWKRLTNTSDTVPTLPYIAMGFVHAGTEVNFTAEYTDTDNAKKIAKNHQICCCYGYALKNPTNVFNIRNQDGRCTFPKPLGSVSVFDIGNHIDGVATYFDSFRTPLDVADQTVSTVYPNSYINMRTQVIDTVGQISTKLPLWMTSKQTDGRVLGFTKAWVIAYTNPGESDVVVYNLKENFGEKLNQINYTSDRYIIDAQLSKNWTPFDDSTESGQWATSAETTFNLDQNTNPTASGNATTFDANSLRFFSPVDVYGFTDQYNKYLPYPKENILQ